MAQKKQETSNTNLDDVKMISNDLKMTSNNLEMTSNNLKMTSNEPSKPMKNKLKGGGKIEFTINI